MVEQVPPQFSSETVNNENVTRLPPTEDAPRSALSLESLSRVAQLGHRARTSDGLTPRFPVLQVVHNPRDE
jgi:hypothetical protein